MKFVHTADWHLGPARNRIDPETGLNARLMDFYRCARFAVEDGIERGAELILHAGDVFNGCRPTPTERRLALEAFNPALMNKVPVIAIVGNHDLPRSPSERHALDALKPARFFDSNLYIVDRPLIYEIWRVGTRLGVCLPDVRDKGETCELQVACLPWPNKNLLLADEEARRLSPGELNLLVAEKMMVMLRGLVQQLRPDIPAVLLGHFSVDLAQAGGQNRLMMLGGEWTLNVHDLANLPFCYQALGHIHKPQDLADGAIRYCGSPEAVTFGEEGEEKGYTLVEIDPHGADEGEAHIVPYHVPTPYRRFVTIEDGIFDWPELKGAIVRVKVSQASDLDFNALRRTAEEAGIHELQIETQKAEAVRRRVVGVTAEMAFEEALRGWIVQRPDLEPLAENLLAEARRVEQILGQEGGVQ